MAETAQQSQQTANSTARPKAAVLPN